MAAHKIATFLRLAASKQPAVHVADFNDINWSSQPAALHHRHGSSIELSEDNTVARRVNPYENLWNVVVMTAEPVSVGTVFQVTVLEKVETWRGSLVSVVMDLRSIPSSKIIVVHDYFTTVHLETWENMEQNLLSFQQQGSQLDYKGTSM